MLNLKSANLKLRFKLRESYNLVTIGVRIGTQDRIGKFKSLQAGIRNYK